MTILSDVEAALPDEFMPWSSIHGAYRSTEIFRAALDQLVNDGRAERMNFSFYRRRPRPKQGAV